MLHHVPSCLKALTLTGRIHAGYGWVTIIIQVYSVCCILDYSALGVLISIKCILYRSFLLALFTVYIQYSVAVVTVNCDHVPLRKLTALRKL